MDTASPPVSPNVVAAIFMIQKIKVTSGIQNGIKKARLEHRIG